VEEVCKSGAVGLENEGTHPQFIEIRELQTGWLVLQKFVIKCTPALHLLSLLSTHAVLFYSLAHCSVAFYLYILNCLFTCRAKWQANYSGVPFRREPDHYASNQ
jgi:hypothetical protein